MKIYHTETQEDFNALRVELKAKGIEWANGTEITAGLEEWKTYGSRTCVRVDGTDAFYREKAYYTRAYPRFPIIKYKEKADEKMRFTKENVEKVVHQHLKETEDSIFVDIVSDVYDMDDTPEKVVVPKCFDEWFKEIVFKYPFPNSAKRFALWKLSQQGFGHHFEDVRGKEISYESDLGEWLFKNKTLAIDAVLNGYTIEPEQLYYIPLPHLETSDGIQQVLSNRDTYFASRPNDKLKQRYTKEELERVPEVYKPYAKPVEKDSE